MSDYLTDGAKSRDWKSWMAGESSWVDGSVTLEKGNQSHWAHSLGARQAELETTKGDQEAGLKGKEGLKGYQKTGLKGKTGVEDFRLFKRWISLFLPPNKSIFSLTGIMSVGSMLVGS